jgi:F0F1-type ATP synthase membrane subunit b/b'
MNLFNNKLYKNKAVEHLMKFSTLALSTLLINTGLLALCSSQDAFAAGSKKAERWFEIEVILFQQLGDKSKLKEQFSEQVDASHLPTYSKAFDLLTPYLQKELTAIKQFIPLCSNSDGLSYFLSTQKELTFALPEQDYFIEQALAVTFEPVVLRHSVEETFQVAKEPLSSENNTALLNINTDEAESSNIVFNWQDKTLNSPLFLANNLCVYSQADFEAIFNEEQLANVNLHGFPITSLTGKLNASGAHTPNSPYLISDDSLLLKDISKRLRWSKEFKPLLHFGWRQIGITRKKAIPLKLFAGQHLENDYQQALKDFQQELLAAQQQEQHLLAQLKASEQSNISEKNSPLNTALNTQVELAEPSYYAHIIKQNYHQLFADINTLDDQNAPRAIIEKTINEISVQTLEDLLADKSLHDEVNRKILAMASPPEKPIQPWILEGFFKVHLDHYLYITADFNIVNERVNNNQGLAGDEDKVKLINFSQNRRVISGEVHYFDHPYLGMVVQIRRFDPTKPADEAVTQAIK